jgi:hypothetical protein
MFIKRVLFAALPILLLLPAAAYAQENPKAEISGAYSLFHATDYVPTGGLNLGSFDNMNLHGWNGSVVGNITSWLGVEGDMSGYYASPSFGPITIPFADVQFHSLMGGPKFAYRGSPSLTPYAHFLVGGAHASAGMFGFSLGENSLAAAIGGGLDIRLNDRIAVRAVQADYLMTRFAEYRQNNIRLSAGIVIRF